MDNGGPNLAHMMHQADQRQAIAQQQAEGLIRATVVGIYGHKVSGCTEQTPADELRRAARESHRAALYLAEAFGLVKVEEKPPEDHRPIM